MGAVVLHTLAARPRPSPFSRCCFLPLLGCPCCVLVLCPLAPLALYPRSFDSSDRRLM